jgi:hypothetical protein
MRENTGFNIGAWDYGWRHLPPYDYYLFLQDDCFIVRPLWLKARSVESCNKTLQCLGFTQVKSLVY